MGNVYFEVSKHLNRPVSWVILNKFNPDVKFLIIKYSHILRSRKKEHDKLQEKYDKQGRL